MEACAQECTTRPSGAAGLGPHSPRLVPAAKKRRTTCVPKVSQMGYIFFRSPKGGCADRQESQARNFWTGAKQIGIQGCAPPGQFHSSRANFLRSDASAALAVRRRPGHTFARISPSAIFLIFRDIRGPIHTICLPVIVSSKFAYFFMESNARTERTETTPGCKFETRPLRFSNQKISEEYDILGRVWVAGFCMDAPWQLGTSVEVEPSLFDLGLGPLKKPVLAAGRIFSRNATFCAACAAASGTGVGSKLKRCSIGGHSEPSSPTHYLRHPAPWKRTCSPRDHSNLWRKQHRN